MKTIKVGSDFSGVGAFDYAIGRVAEQKGFKVENVFACDMDKHARKSYLANHGDPGYYPENVYEREIPSESLDVYMTSPPCQAFSMAGARQGKNDSRGILFFNSLEFIEKNQPRFFIFENVKGLLSDDNGKTFSEWINLLGGKSVNGLPVLFPYENSVDYHVYWQVLNAKEHGVPQNRERVFIIGIRDDADNNFRFPKTEHLEKRLKDVLEDGIDIEKYAISKKAFERLTNVESSFKSLIKTENDIASTHGATDYSKIARGMNILKVKSATLKGYEIAEIGDSINFAELTSTTRRGRVGKDVSQTIDCVMTIATMEKRENDFIIRRLTPRECFRLMDFPESFEFVVSDSQLYKQAGNSIVVRVLEKILSNLNF